MIYKKKTQVEGMEGVHFVKQAKIMVRLLAFLSNSKVVKVSSVLHFLDNIVETMVSEIPVGEPDRDKEKEITKERVQIEQNSLWFLSEIVLQNLFFFVDLHRLVPEDFGILSRLIVRIQNLIESLISHLHQHAEDLRAIPQLLARTDQASEWIMNVRTKLESVPLALILEKASSNSVDRVVVQKKRLSALEGHFGDNVSIDLQDEDHIQLLPSIQDLKVVFFQKIDLGPLWFSDLFGCPSFVSSNVPESVLSPFETDLMSSFFTVCFLLLFLTENITLTQKQQKDELVLSKGDHKLLIHSLRHTFEGDLTVPVRVLISTLFNELLTFPNRSIAFPNLCFVLISVLKSIPKVFSPFFL